VSARNLIALREIFRAAEDAELKAHWVMCKAKEAMKAQTIIWEDANLKWEMALRAKDETRMAYYAALNISGKDD